MKNLISFDQDLGGDGAKLNGGLGVAGDQLQAQVSVSYPIAKIIEPAAKVIDQLVDKLEALIPGDQKAMAASAKADARAALVKALSEQSEPAPEVVPSQVAAPQE